MCKTVSYSPRRNRGSNIALLCLLAFAVGVMSVCGCSSMKPGGRPDSLFESSIVTAADVKNAIQIEEGFSNRYYKRPPNGESWAAVKSGDSSVLVVAGHTTSHVRRDEIRPPDVATGALALTLNELTGTTIVYANYASPSDPNFFEDNELKDALADVIRDEEPVLVLDLHASHAFRPHDIDFGTMHGRSLLGRSYYLEDLVTALEREGVFNLSQDTFPAEKGQTITKAASNLGVPSIQLEISSTYLLEGDGELHAHRFAQLLQALVRFVRDVDATR